MGARDQSHPRCQTLSVTDPTLIEELMEKDARFFVGLRHMLGTISSSDDVDKIHKFYENYTQHSFRKPPEEVPVADYLTYEEGQEEFLAGHPQFKEQMEDLRNRVVYTGKDGAHAKKGHARSRPGSAPTGLRRQQGGSAFRSRPQSAAFKDPTETAFGEYKPSNNRGFDTATPESSARSAWYKCRSRLW